MREMKVKPARANIPKGNETKISGEELLENAGHFSKVLGGKGLFGGF